jgi:uncharacterized membrane protein
MSIGSTSAYTAVPLADVKPVATSDDSDIVMVASSEEQYRINSQIHQAEDNDDSATSLGKPLLSNPTITSMDATRLKILAFTTGCLAALFSQYILAQILWNEDVVTLSTKSIIIFSFNWTFWTCLMIFSSLMSFTRIVSGSDAFDRENWEDLLFSLESHHIVGSLLSVSVSWFAADFLHIHQLPQKVHNLSLLLLLMASYAIFFRFMTVRVQKRRLRLLEQENADKNASAAMMPTYQMLAATLGLIIGLTSQFILSFLLWNDNMRKPVLGNVFVFPVVWSVLTVIFTFAGCATLRFLVAKTESVLETERIFLRMESHYVFCSLIGISLAWILMNIALGMSDHVLPSIVLLFISLGVFRFILWCFPEESCIAEIELQQQRELVKFSKMPLVVEVV